MKKRAWTAGLVAGATALSVLGQSATEQAGPFQRLEWTDSVKTSRNGYSVWVSLVSAEHEARLPGHESAMASTDVPPHHAVLQLQCRARGGSLPGSTPPSGSMNIDDHPDQPWAYTVVHPMHWILELLDKHREHWPVQVQIDEEAPQASTLTRSLTNYSIPEPGLYIVIEGDKVREAMATQESVAVRAWSDEVEFKGRFAVTENAKRAARLMRTACGAL